MEDLDTLRHLLSSEESFLKTLKQVQRSFLSFLKEKDFSVNRDPKLVVLFSNVEQIEMLGTLFRDHLQLTIQSADTTKRKYQREKNLLKIASMFMTHSPLFVIYGRYTQLSLEVIQLLEARRVDDANLSSFLSTCPMYDKLLTIPCGRVSKYMQTLVALARGVDKDGLAYSKVERAIAIVKRSALDIEDSVSNYQNDQRFGQIKKRFKTSNGIDLSKSGRLLIQDDTVSMVSTMGKKKGVKIVLFNDCFMIGWRNKLRYEYPLHVSAVEDLEESKANRRILGVCTSKAAFLFEFASSESKVNWTRLMEKAIKEERLSKSGHADRPMGLCSIDTLKSKCKLCQKNIGKLWSKGYQCVYCDTVVCGKCSASPGAAGTPSSIGRRSDSPARALMIMRQGRHLSDASSRESSIAPSPRGALSQTSDSSKNRICTNCQGKIAKNPMHLLQTPTRASASVRSHSRAFMGSAISSVESSMVGSMVQQQDKKGEAGTKPSNPGTPRMPGTPNSQRAKSLKRLAIAKKLLKSERQYVETLIKINRTVIRPTFFMTKTGIVERLPKHVIIFLDRLEQITAINFQLLQDLQSRVDAWHQQQPLGEVFIQMQPLGLVYQQYYEAFASVLKTMEDPRWNAWFKRQKISIGQETYGVRVFLSLPIQRLFAYKEYIQDLIPITSRIHADYRHLEQAAEEIEVTLKKAPKLSSDQKVSYDVATTYLEEDKEDGKTLSSEARDSAFGSQDDTPSTIAVIDMIVPKLSFVENDRPEIVPKLDVQRSNGAQTPLARK